MPDFKDRRVVLKESAARKITQATREHVRTVRGTGIGRRESPPRLGPSDRLARTPAGGIATLSTGVVTLFSAFDTLGSATVTVRNPWGVNAPANTRCIIGPLGGVGLAIKSWDC